jgi:hypothetical protein
MTRTPTTSVTASAFAARAFAWDLSPGACLSGLASGMLLPLFRSNSH